MLAPDAFALLKYARQQMPALKYAIGVVGLAAAAALVRAYFNSLWLGLSASAAILIPMLLLLLFQAAAKSKTLHQPAIVLTWAILLLFIAVAALLVTSAFFDMPKPLSALLGVQPLSVQSPATGTSPAPLTAKPEPLVLLSKLVPNQENIHIAGPPVAFVDVAFHIQDLTGLNMVIDNDISGRVAGDYDAKWAILLEALAEQRGAVVTVEHTTIRALKKGAPVDVPFDVIRIARPQRLVQEHLSPIIDHHPMYTGEPISLNLKNLDVRAAMQTFADLVGANVIVDQDVSGVVSARFTDIPWDFALDVICRSNGLYWTMQDNVFRIAKRETLEQHQQLLTGALPSAPH